MKRILSLAILMSFSQFLSFAEHEFLIDGYGTYSVPLITSSDEDYFGQLKNSFGGGADVEFRPLKHLGIAAGFSFYPYGNKISGVSSSQIVSGTVGAKGIMPMGERLVASAGVNGGYYSFSRDSLGFSGLSAGATASFDFRISPFLSIYMGGTFNRFFHTTFSINNAGANAGVRISLSKAFNRQKNISVEVVEMDPVFPVLYSWYNDNPFATVSLQNNEECSITDVEVSFYQEEFMTTEKKYDPIKRIRRNDSAQIELTAFFNESILSLIEPVQKNAVLKVSYKILGEKRSMDIPISVDFFNRNNMSWADDRRAAVFVSPNDAEAKSFAKQVRAIVRNHLDQKKNQNAQLAMALFESLKLYGLNYVVDPASSYSANAGNVSIDFLQFPYQTLNYRGGDCDDLSILYCSLLETLGIEGAFITVPGHIFTGFCLGETDEAIALAESAVLKDGLIYYEGKIWQPIEITMLKDGYKRACAFGVQEWEKYSSEALIYPIHSAWELYSSVNSPERKKEISVQNKEKLLRDFDNQLKHID